MLYTLIGACLLFGVLLFGGAEWWIRMQCDETTDEN